MNIAELLSPFGGDLTPSQLDQVSKYTDLLLRWNARMNLTAIRDPEQIVVRHFGESFYLAGRLSSSGLFSSAASGHSPKVVDVGSGAGFPGIPLKIALPHITLTLIEAQQRKAVFLKEVLRALGLEAEVNNVRAEELARVQPQAADVVTMRAVERFEAILPVAGRLVRPLGHLAVLIGAGQAELVKSSLSSWSLSPLLPIPGSKNRAILIANQVG